MAATLTLDISNVVPAKASAIKVRATGVTVGAKRSLDATPNANIDGPVEVQTMAYENMRISCTGVHFVSASELSQTDLNELMTTKFDGSNPVYLSIVYGKAGATQQVKSLGGQTSIPVVLESYDFPLSTTDSDEAYMPVGSLTFIETATD